MTGARMQREAEIMFPAMDLREAGSCEANANLSQEI